MKPTTLMIIGGLILMASAFVGKSTPEPDIIPVPVPSASMQAMCQPIKDALAGHPQAAEFSSFWRTLAEVVGRDTDTIKTKYDLTKYMKAASVLRFEGLFQKVPKLNDLIHGPKGVIMQHLGDKPGPLDHAAAKEVLLGIAWAGEP